MMRMTRRRLSRALLVDTFSTKGDSTRSRDTVIEVLVEGVSVVVVGTETLLWVANRAKTAL